VDIDHADGRAAGTLVRLPRSPTDYIAFPASGGAGATVTHFSTGKTGGGAAPILWSGIITPALVMGGPGVTPRLTPATTVALA
jgi:hypothetical protein